MNILLQNMANYYRQQYGDETDELILSLRISQEKIALKNPFLNSDLAQAIKEINGDADAIFDMLFCCANKAKSLVDKKPSETLAKYYLIDPSSAFPALLLPLKKGMKVLDMCSAPGGKLLVMMCRLIDEVNFYANDISKARSYRLRRVINEFLPQDLIKSHLKIFCKDANFFGTKTKNYFDAVLLDAPCSSEGHVAQRESLLTSFKGLNRGLPYRQYSLLCAALLATKPGGHIMYSTCSINKNENEGVIKKLLQKKSDLCQLVKTPIKMGRDTGYGIQILPHRDGAGPAFFSLIKKKYQTAYNI